MPRETNCRQIVRTLARRSVAPGVGANVVPSLVEPSPQVAAPSGEKVHSGAASVLWGELENLSVVGGCGRALAWFCGRRAAGAAHCPPPGGASPRGGARKQQSWPKVQGKAPSSRDCRWTSQVWATHVGRCCAPC
mmetsp:Transcript_27324/g.76890  ORF Transcript_27324/g.76890 Transcript_27324/m.76890 type:complete len:135 (-) Transcript_27324:370-774(-)